MRFNRTHKIFQGSGSGIAIVIGILILPFCVIGLLLNPAPRTKYVNECTKSGKSECECFKEYHINECLHETNNTYSRCVQYANDNARALNIKGCY